MPFLLQLFLLYWQIWHGISDAAANQQGKPSERGSVAQPFISRSSSSSCRPLDSFVKCYNVAVPNLEGLFDESAVYRGAALPVTMRAFDREFRFRLHMDAEKPENAWSSVISPAAVVRVMGENGAVNEYPKNQLGISWYTGRDEFEVASSSVQASVVNSSGQQQFRAVVRTTSDIYYIEPAADHPQV